VREDVELTLRNAMAFNPLGSDVYLFAEMLDVSVWGAQP